MPSNSSGIPCLQQLSICTSPARKKQKCHGKGLMDNCRDAGSCLAHHWMLQDWDTQFTSLCLTLFICPLHKPKCIGGLDFLILSLQVISFPFSLIFPLAGGPLLSPLVLGAPWCFPAHSCNIISPNFTELQLLLIYPCLSSTTLTLPANSSAWGHPSKGHFLALSSITYALWQVRFQPPCRTLFPMHQYAILVQEQDPNESVHRWSTK